MGEVSAGGSEGGSNSERGIPVPASADSGRAAGGGSSDGAGVDSSQPAGAGESTKERGNPMKFFRYCAANPYTTTVALGMLLNLAAAASAAPPDKRFAMLTTPESWSIVVGAIALLTGQDPKNLKKDE